MKTITGIFIAALMMFQTQASAQVTEVYIPNNLGRIVEIATPTGVLADYHVLFGMDSTGFVRRSNTEDNYKIFGTYPNQTYLNLKDNVLPLNRYNLFGAVSGNDCIEIRFGDSSHYWINNTTAGGYLAKAKAPFSFYNAGPRSAANPSVTGGYKLCFKVVDEFADSLYTPGEIIYVYGETTQPVDSSYDQLASLPANPFAVNQSYIYRLRFGKAIVPYSQSTFNVVTDGALPDSGTVIRLVAQSSDTSKPCISFPDSITGYMGMNTYPVAIYSFETPQCTLINAPEGMSVSDNGITWNVLEDQNGITYSVTLVCTNSQGSAIRNFTARASCSLPGIREILTEGSGNRMRLWSRNDGSIAYRSNQSTHGLEYPVGLNYVLNYAGGLYIAAIKHGTGGAPDSISVANCEYESEFQPGRILNSGPFGSLAGEDFNVNPTYFHLPGHEACWPAEAPHHSNGNPLKLSVVDTWTVFNDLDISRSKPDNQNLNEFSPGLGFEVQRMTFQFNQYPFDNAVLIRYLFINKSDRTYDSCYIGFWDDPDIVTGSSDLVASDSALSVLVSYNTYYPVAYGSLLLQGPLVEGTIGDSARITDIGTDGFHHYLFPGKKALQACSFLHYPNPNGEPARLSGDKTRYWYLKGLDGFGNPKPGGPFDPVYLNPGNRKGTIGTGPMTIAAGDSLLVWHAMVGGYDPVDSSAKDTVLYYAQLMRSIFNNNMNDYRVGIHDTPVKPNHFTLYQNYPNPFNPSTVIRYQLAVSSKVALKIYNILGQEVRTLVNKPQSAGVHSVVWDGKNNQGQRVSSGVYLYRLEAGDFAKTRKMVLVK